MIAARTKEPQNQEQIDTYAEDGPVRLGPWSSHIWRSDPRHLGFMLARYKFCAKMLAGKSTVVEIGCGDAFGTTVVLQTVGSVLGIDFEPLVLEDAKARLSAEGVRRCSFAVHDITQSPLSGIYDAAYSLDVIEHVPAEAEDRLMTNICSSLTPHAVCIIGTPNKEAQRYATPASAAGHINLKNADELLDLLSGYFHNVFIFSMNDEIVHTGFYPMAHYLLGMGVGLKTGG
ncbi:MAG: class I SAM-dependent methyltransferase [Nitrospirae bacterium]|nr:class I SAM-dependent methyltransferase [Nitrospirota bacterium]